MFQMVIYVGKWVVRNVVAVAGPVALAVVGVLGLVSRASAQLPDAPTYTGVYTNITAGLTAGTQTVSWGVNSVYAVSVAMLVLSIIWLIRRRAGQK